MSVQWFCENSQSCGHLPKSQQCWAVRAFQRSCERFCDAQGCFLSQDTTSVQPEYLCQRAELYKQSPAAKIVFILHAVVVTASYGNGLQISRFITLHGSTPLSSKLSLPGCALGTHTLVPSCFCAALVTASVPQCPFSLCVINPCINVL